MTPNLLVTRLQAIRDLLEPGWTEPFCLDTEGRICGEDDEGVKSYSLVGALRLVCQPGEAVEVMNALEVMAVPARVEVERAALAGDEKAQVRASKAAGATESLEDWLEGSGHGPRMRLLALVIQRAKARAREAA